MRDVIVIALVQELDIERLVLVESERHALQLIRAQLELQVGLFRGNNRSPKASMALRVSSKLLMLFIMQILPFCAVPETNKTHHKYTWHACQVACM